MGKCPKSYNLLPNGSVLEPLDSGLYYRSVCEKSTQMQPYRVKMKCFKKILQIKKNGQQCISKCASVAQWSKCLALKQGSTGSNPSKTTGFFSPFLLQFLSNSDYKLCLTVKICFENVK